jgi:UDP-N-acetyl-2-amino-2-deoxyglucuronate dehydrogenase
MFDYSIFFVFSEDHVIPMKIMNFAMLGVGGFVAPRHLQAIAGIGGRLVAACDPHDSVGILDQYFPDAAFFTEVERFDRHLEKLKRMSDDQRVHYVSICSPNYLHDAHVRLALRIGADAICEKPLVINPWNLDQLAALENETGSRVFTIFQLRLVPLLVELKSELLAKPPKQKLNVKLTYCTRRGRWYHVSWKGSPEKSGGLITNIGVHLFDLMLWLFGDVERSEVHANEKECAAGYLELTHARVAWCLMIHDNKFPNPSGSNVGEPLRMMSVNDKHYDFSTMFSQLHTKVYEQVVRGDGLGISDARPAIELSYQIRTSTVVKPTNGNHPWLENEFCNIERS